MTNGTGAQAPKWVRAAFLVEMLAVAVTAVLLILNRVFDVAGYAITALQISALTIILAAGLVFLIGRRLHAHRNE